MSCSEARDRPALLVPRDGGNVLSYALSAWSAPRTRPRVLRRYVIARLPRLALWLAGWPVVTIATHDASPPYVVAAALQLLEPESSVDWLLVCGQSDDLGRAAFLLFPQGEPRPHWIVKFVRVPSYPEPIDRDERALQPWPKPVARLPLTRRASSAGSKRAGWPPRSRPPRWDVACRPFWAPPAPVRRRRGSWARWRTGLSALVSRRVMTAPGRSWSDSATRSSPPGPPLPTTCYTVSGLPAVLQHNDLGPWNIISEGGSEFIAVDWESANPSGLPLWDLWYFLAHALRLVDGEDAADDIAFSRLFRGEAASSPELFRWTRTAVEALDIPPDAVGRLATLCCGSTTDSRARREAQPSTESPREARRLRPRHTHTHTPGFPIRRSGAAGEAGWTRRTRLVRPVLAPPPVGTFVGGATPTFSAVIAAYDAADTIPDALESLLSRPSGNARSGGRDDGSQDDLAAALAPFRDRITLVRQDHGGEGAAKNNGAFHARRGDFIVFLDADDTFLPELARGARRTGSGAPRPRHPDHRRFSRGRRRGGSTLSMKPAGLSKYTISEQRFSSKILVFGHAAVRRTRFLESGGFDPSITFGTAGTCPIRCWRLSRRPRQRTPGALPAPAGTSLSANRAALTGGRCRVLERAASRGGLTLDERRRAQTALSQRSNATRF